MRRFLIVGLIITALILSACGGGDTEPTPAPAEQPTTSTAEQPTTAPAEQATEAPAMADLSGKLTSAGSSALLPLIQLAATQFQQMHEGVEITVTAGGSGAGRSQVCQGQVDIGNSDVPLSDQEKTDLNCGDAVETAVAIQAFGPVANKVGPGSVTSLTKEQLQGIFSGTITNWSEVGGDDQAIVVVNRAKGSGTRKNMANYLFDGDDEQFTVGASEEDNNETVLQTIVQAPGAISYLGFAYLGNPELVAFAIDDVAPSREDIQNGSWPIAAPGYSITKDAPTELEQAFLDFVTSAEFQNSTEFGQLGFVPVVDENGNMPSSGDAMTEPAEAPAEDTAMMEVSGKLTSAGSSALLPLIQLAATQFQQMHEGVEITVTAGGSGAGRSQVCQGQVDIGNSDVPLSDQEKTDLNCGDAVETAVAIQAFGPVANKVGPGSVTSLTKEQLQGIFSGTITNWSEVGGDDQAIVVVNRAKGSGTRKNMANYLFDGDDEQFTVGASEEDNNETVLQTIVQAPGAISYLGFAYLGNPELVAFAIDDVAPSREDIQNGSWPIAAPGYSITKDAPTELEQAFLDFVTSAEFQNSTEFGQLGFVPVAQ